MKCTLSLKIPTFAALLALCIGGSFSSLRGAILEATPANLIAQNNLLKPGDTLLFRAGVYPQQLFNGIGGWQWKSGTSTLPVTYKAFPGESVTIRPGAGAYRVMDFGQSTADQYIVVDGLILDAANCQYDAIKINSPAHHLSFKNGEAKNARNGQGFLIVKGCPSNLISRFKVYRNGTSDPTGHDHGLYISSADNVIEYSEVFENGAYGIHIFDQTVPQGVVRNIARFNKLWGNGTAHKQSAALGIVSGSDNQAIKNEILSDPYCGIRVQYGATRTIIDSNKAVGGTLADIYIGADSTNATVKNNCVDRLVNLSSSSTLSNNSPSGCGGNTPPPPTNVNVTQTQPPVYQQQPPSTSQPSGPSTSQVAIPFLIAGVIGAALILGSD